MSRHGIYDPKWGFIPDEDCPKKEGKTLCLNCEHKRYCKTGNNQPRADCYVTGCSRFEQKETQTNADRIRGMSDDELAEMFARVTDCGECPHERWPGCSVNEESCVKRWLEWLKQEAEDD